MDFVAQTVYPSDAAPSLEQFSTSVLLSAEEAFGEAGPAILADPIARRRLPLPQRLGGSGLRDRAQLRHAAFVGTTCAAVSRMLPRTLGGASFLGYMPQLAGVLGVGSFNTGRNDRFTSLLRSGCRHGREFNESWTAMVDEVEATSTHITTTGPLAAVVECAGVDADGKPLARMQQLLTRQRDEASMRELKDVVAMRPVHDNARCAFEAAVGCPSARAWYATPSRSVTCRMPILEVVATAFAAPSPALKPHVGKRIMGSSCLVDLRLGLLQQHRPRR